MLPKNIEYFVVKINSKINHALKKINKNLYGIIFVVSDTNTLLGSISDGDIRRYIIKHKNISEKIIINSKLINKNVKTINSQDDDKKLFNLLEKGYKVVPKVNKQNQLVDICTYKNIISFPISTPQISKEEVSLVNKCLQTGWISSRGSYIDTFEKKFSEFLNFGHSVAVSSGTTALELAIKSLQLPKKSEIILPNFTFAATINSIINSGMIPVLCDVRKDTWTIDYLKIKKLINNKTKAIMPVQIYGQAYHVDIIHKIAKEKNLYIIEDCAEGLGGKYKNKIVNKKADVICYSFFANKVITTGEGGMAVFKDIKNFNTAKMIRSHGMDPVKKYNHNIEGSNYRMTNIQAAIGMAQLKKIDYFLKKRKIIFSIYDKYLSKVKYISLLPKNTWSKNSYWLYTILVNDFGPRKREILLERLNKNGIEARNGFISLNKMKPFKKYSKIHLPISNYLSENSISLPTSINLTKNQIKYIVDLLILNIEELTNVK